MTTLAPSGFLAIGASDLEYRMIGPAPDQAPTIVMLHEGLGSAALWGDFPDKLQAATRAGVFVYSRSGYGASSGPGPIMRYSRSDAPMRINPVGTSAVMLFAGVAVSSLRSLPPCGGGLGRGKPRALNSRRPPLQLSPTRGERAECA